MSEDDQFKKMGKAIGRGMADGILRELAFAVLALLLIGWVLGLLGFPARDDTDPTSGKRSGLASHTDEATGCEYLSKGNGLTPRLGPDGRQICRRGVQ